MPKQKGNNQDAYGSFLVNKSFLQRVINLKQLPASLSKKQQYVSAGIFALILVMGVSGFVFFKNKHEQKLAYIHEALAVEIPGWWYKEYFGYSVCDNNRCIGYADPDGDKLNNAQEFYYKTDPLRKDTNDNGATDGEDVANNIEPSKKGNLTFEQAASDENILGESLVFDQDVKNELAKSFDLTKVSLSLPADAELTIILEPSQRDIDNYFASVDALVKKYLPYPDLDAMQQLVATADDSTMQKISQDSIMLSSEIKKLPVPNPLITLHKYSIKLYELMPGVLAGSRPEFMNQSAAEQNAWFDKAQVYLVMSQKMDFELKQAKELTK